MHFCPEPPAAPHRRGGEGAREALSVGTPPVTPPVVTAPVRKQREATGGAAGGDARGTEPRACLLLHGHSGRCEALEKGTGRAAPSAARSARNTEAPRRAAAAVLPASWRGSVTLNTGFGI